MGRKRRPRAARRRRNTVRDTQDNERAFYALVTAEANWLQGLLDERGYMGSVYFPWGGEDTVGGLLQNLADKVLARGRWLP